MSKNATLEIINSTAAGKIAELDMVKDKFVKNYNLANNSTNGDLMYHRQLIHFNQSINGLPALQNCDKFSLYACFITAAVKGYSFDPLDSEIYLVPRAGKACMQLQAGAYVRRLVQTKQVTGCEQAKLVFKGDIFEVEDGIVKKHIEKFETETIIAGYVKFNTAGESFKYLIYRKSDFDAWKKKSQQPNGDNWSGGIDGQPGFAFLRTKIILHAAKEKCWFTGSTPASVEQFNVEIENEDFEPEPPAEPFVPPAPEYSNFEEVPSVNPPDENKPLVDEDAF